MIDKFFGKSAILFLSIFILLFTYANAQVVIKDTVSIRPSAKGLSTLSAPSIPGGYHARYHTYSWYCCGFKSPVCKIILNGTTILDICAGGFVVGTIIGDVERVEDIGDVQLEAYTRYPQYGSMAVTIAEVDPYNYNVYFDGIYEGQINLWERVPKPSVYISYPRNQIITLSKNYQPLIIPNVNYTPSSGQFKADVSFSPTEINTADYYDQLAMTNDYIEIPITATASNERGTAYDTTKFYLTRSKIPESFRVTVSPNELDYYDTASVTAIALDEKGNEINFPEDEWVIVQLDEDHFWDYGSFSSATGGTGVIIWAQYGELKRGEVQFIANGIVTLSIDEVEVHVRAYDADGFDVASIDSDILDHFEVIATPDTIEYKAAEEETGGAAKINNNSSVNVSGGGPINRSTILAIAKDKYDNEINLMWEAEIKIIDAPSGFGHLEEAWNELVRPTRPDPDSLIMVKLVQLLQGNEKINGLQRSYLQALINDTAALRQAFGINLSKKNPQPHTGSIKNRNLKLKAKTIEGISEEGDPDPLELVTSYSQVYYGSVAYIADGIVPVQDTIINIVVSSTAKPEATGIDTLVITPPSCPEVVLAKEQINPGDTIDVTVKKKLLDGTLRDYPSGTTFNIGIDEGGEYGNLLVYGELGPSFDYVEVPIQFVANENIPADSVAVKIKATVNSNGGGMAGNIKSKSKQGEQTLSAKKNGQKFRTNDAGFCSLFSMVSIEKIILEFDYPTEDQIIEGNTAPVWTKPITARLKNFKDGDVTFNWDMNVKWDGDAIKTPMNDNLYKGQAHGTNDNWVNLEIKTDNPLLGGDKVTLHAKAETKNKGSFEDRKENIFVIKGRNPAKNIILNELNADKYKAIGYHETGFNQFHKRKYIEEKNKLTGPSQVIEYPYQGVDDARDIGIMQINNPKADAIVWDWTANVQKGKEIYNWFENYALKYLKKISGFTDFTDEQLLKESYCKYNKGQGVNYWKFKKADPKKGIAAKLIEETDARRNWRIGRNYAKTVYSVYITKPWN